MDDEGVSKLVKRLPQALSHDAKDRSVSADSGRQSTRNVFRCNYPEQTSRADMSNVTLTLSQNMAGTFLVSDVVQTIIPRIVLRGS